MKQGKEGANVTPRERSIRAMRSPSQTRKELPDRVPVVPLIDTSYAARLYGIPISKGFLSPEEHAKALIACLEQHCHIDGLSINLCLSESVILDITEEGDTLRVKTVGGVTWEVPYDDIGTPVEREIVSFDDERLHLDDPFRAGIVDTLRNFPRDILSNYLINVGLTGPYSQVVFLMGLERVMTGLIDDPDGVIRAIEARVPFTLNWAKELADLGAPCIWIGEGLASSTLISPQMYKEFVLPYEEKVVSYIHSLGLPCIIHICGNATPILELIAQSGADCLELDWQVDIGHAKKAIGNSMCLKGNLNTTLLVSGRPEEIYREANKCILAAAEGGGFILSSGCAVGRDTPRENVDAMIKATIEHSYEDKSV